MVNKYDLAYYVYVENVNKRKIEKYNVLNTGIIAEILERADAALKAKNKKTFAEEVERVLMYHYWSRSEWEIILTDWPTHIKPDELDRLNKELNSYKKQYGYAPYCLTVNLTTEEKIDVYDQVKLNWTIFIDYLWNNLQNIMFCCQNLVLN